MSFHLIQSPCVLIEIEIECFKQFLPVAEFHEPATWQGAFATLLWQWEEVGADLWSGGWYLWFVLHLILIGIIIFLWKVFGYGVSHVISSYCACLVQERFQVKNPPHTYIQKLRGFLDPAVTRKVRWEMQCYSHHDRLVTGIYSSLFLLHFYRNIIS